MSLYPKLIAGGLAGIGLLLSAGAALADPAQATASVNVRSGPGTNYGVVATLYPGESVDVQNCNGPWCYIQHNGPAGWVSANYLDEGGGGTYTPPQAYDDEGPYYDEPGYYEPAPVYINPPPVYVRPPYPHNHFHWPPPGNGNNPPPHKPPPHKPPPNGGNPPWTPPGGNNNHPHFNFPNGGNPPVFHQQQHFNARVGNGGANICQTDPAACQPRQHHQH